MPANMSRLAQVGGMSTRESLNRPRLGVSRWQGEHVLDDRLNKAATRGYDGPATTVYNRRASVGVSAKFSYPKQEKIYGKGCDVKYLLLQCRNADPNWKPGQFAKTADKNHPVLRGQGMLK